jgi:CRISPR/Cas system-associated exonuclease Cas4 (RecB family)
MAGGLSQWSYSTITGWQQCPKRTKLRKVDKLPDPSGPAAERGTHFHKQVELYLTKGLPLTNHGAYVPPKLDAFVPLLDKLRGYDLGVERQVAFDRSWRQVDFFGEEAWGRMVWDVSWYDAPVARIIDWKTGKPRPGEHGIQLELYSAAAMLLHPEAERVVATDEYLDIGPQGRLSHTMMRGEEVSVLDRWRRLAEMMENDTLFPARPGQHCRWCAFRGSKGGPCEFG